MRDIKTLFRQSDGEMIMTLGAIGENSTGIHELVQRVTNILLTDPGESLYNTGVGAGIKRITSSSGSSGSNAEAQKSQITAAVMDTETYIIKGQIGEALTDEEKLKSLTIARLLYNGTSREWIIDIIVETAAGTISVATIS
jgi:hypothetical protein